MQKRLGSLFGFAALFATVSAFAQTSSKPVAVDDKAVLGNGPSVRIPVLVNDTYDVEDITVEVPRAWKPKGGKVEIVADHPLDHITKSWVVIYTPGPAFAGYDSFQYRISYTPAGSKVPIESDPATVTVFGARFAIAGPLGANILDRSGKQVGYLRLEAMSTGIFSGKVSIGTKVYELLGRLDANGRYVGYARAKDGKILALSLAVKDKGGVPRITGTFGGTAEWRIAQDVSSLSEKGLAALAGRYTVELPASVADQTDSFDGGASKDESGRKIPEGAGWMTIEINEQGSARLTGKTGDNRSFSVSAQVIGTDTDPELPFFAAWDESLLSGTLKIGDTVDGTLSWSLGETDDKMYPDGFDATVAAHGRRYVKPEDRDRILRDDTSDAGRATVTITGGGTPEFSRELRFTEDDEVSVLDEGDDRINLEIDRRNGTFRGQFRDPDDNDQVLSFSGVLLQTEGRGIGVFDAHVKTGRVTLEVKVDTDTEDDNESDSVDESNL